MWPVDSLGYAVVQVTKMTGGDASKLSKATLNTYNLGTSSSLGMLDYTLYVKGLRDKADINMYLAKKG